MDGKLAEQPSSKGCDKQQSPAGGWGQSPVVEAGPNTVHIFIRDLDDGTERTLGLFAANTTLGGRVDTADECAASQRDLNRLQKQASRNLMKFNTERQSPSCLEESPPTTGTSTGWVPTSWKVVL